MLVGEGALRTLSLAAKLLHSFLVIGNIFTMLSLYELNKIFHDPLIEILAYKDSLIKWMQNFLRVFELTTEMCISICRNDFKHTVVYSQNGNIECASTKIKNKNILLSLLIKTIGDGRCSRFIDDSCNVESRDSPSIFCCLTLCVIKIC